MRRPTFCSEFDEDDKTMSTSPEPSDKESRLSKVKRILTTTILLGRKGKKESLSTTKTGQRDYGENESDYYDNEGMEKELMTDLEKSKNKMEENLNKSKSTKGIQTKSSKAGSGRFDENVEPEKLTKKKEFSICLTKNGENGSRKSKEIRIDLDGDEMTSTTAEIVLKPRKRKERLDSEGSIKQENKVIRSNSEERPEGGGNERKESNMRKVSSQEDFSNIRVLQEINPLQASILSWGSEERNYQRNDFRTEEIYRNAEECERIRSCERFARSVAPPRGRRNYPRKRIKGSKKKMEYEDEVSIPKADSTMEEAEETKKGSVNSIGSERDSSSSSKESSSSSSSSSSTSSSPALDFTSLYKLTEGSEPVTSRGMVVSPEDEPEKPSIEVLISPRNSLVMRLMNSDPSIPPSPPGEQHSRHGNYDSQERKLTKQINSIKRKLKRYEEGFQEEFGYRPSQADKLANKDIKKLCSDLNKLRAQLKQYKEDSLESDGFSRPKQLNFLTSLEGNVSSNQTGNPAVTKHGKIGKTMEEVFQEVEKRLQEKRQQSGRSSEISEMNRGDLLEEKLAVQKALLHLENVFGRPATKEDRDLVRPLYQRYRSLKRLVVRNSGTKLNNSTGELATILEHEAMEFTNSPSTSFDLAEGTFSAPEGLDMPSAAAALATATATEVDCRSPKPPLSEESQNVSSSSSDSLGENLHSLPLCQLLEQQKLAKEEKKNLRRSLKEFEESFQSVTGRRAQKQDRIVVEGIYANYKKVKAKLRLLDALISKKSFVKRNSC